MLLSIFLPQVIHHNFVLISTYIIYSKISLYSSEIIVVNTSFPEFPRICPDSDELESFKNCVEGVNSFVKTNQPAAVTSVFSIDNISWKVAPTVGSIGFNETTSMWLSFENNTEYYLFIYAKNFAFPTANPSVTPKTFLKVHLTDKYIIIFLKVSMNILNSLNNFRGQK